MHREIIAFWGATALSILGTAAHAAPTDAACSSSDTKAIAHWSFEGNFNDVSGNGYDGAPKNGTTFGEGKVGKGLVLDGKHGSASNGTAAVKKPVPVSVFRSGDYTISGYFKSSGNGNNSQDIVSATDDKGGHGILIELAPDGRMRFLHRLPFSGNPDTGVNLYSKTGVNLNDGQFHSFQAITRAGKLELLIDNVSQGTANEKSEFNKDLYVVIGKLSDKEQSNQRHFKGVLDEIKIYNHADVNTGDCAAMAATASEKVPDTSTMMTAAVGGRVVASGNAYYFYREGNQAKIDQKKTPIQLIKEDLGGGKIAFKVSGTPASYISVVDASKERPQNNCHSAFLGFTSNAQDRAEFVVRPAKMPPCAAGNEAFCVKPEDLFVSYESVAKPGTFMRHCGFVIGLQKPSANPNATEIGDMTWRMQSAK